MNITLVSANSSLEGYLNQVTQGNLIKSYPNIINLYDKVISSAVRTQLLIIQDNAIDIKDFDKLIDIINHKFFYCSKIVFLNLTANLSHKERYEFIAEEVKNSKISLEIIVITKDNFKSTDLLNIIKEDNKIFEEVETSNIAIVQTSRHNVNRTILGNKMLTPSDVDGVFKDDFKEVNEEKFIKTFQNDTNPINLNNKDIMPEIVYDTFETEISKVDRQIFQDNQKSYKYLICTGIRNSGVTSTAFTMGVCASKYGKTLIVDCDNITMGASLLSEIFIETPLLLPVKLGVISTANLYKKGLNEIKSETMDSAPLHILTINYDLTKKINNISLLLLNIVNAIKDNYRYIIFDIPISNINNCVDIITQFSDKILINNIPYINKTINILRDIKEKTILLSTSQFKNDNLIIYNIGIPNENKIPILSRSQLNNYISNIFGKEVKATKIFQLIGANYEDAMPFFKEIMEVRE